MVSDNCFLGGFLFASTGEGNEVRPPFVGARGFHQRYSGTKFPKMGVHGAEGAGLENFREALITLLRINLIKNDKIIGDTFFSEMGHLNCERMHKNRMISVGIPIKFFKEKFDGAGAPLRCKKGGSDPRII